jgi:hypothetical protein
MFAMENVVGIVDYCSPQTVAKVKRTPILTAGVALPTKKVSWLDPHLLFCSWWAQVFSLSISSVLPFVVSSFSNYMAFFNF